VEIFYVPQAGPSSTLYIFTSPGLA